MVGLDNQKNSDFYNSKLHFSNEILKALLESTFNIKSEIELIPDY